MKKIFAILFCNLLILLAGILILEFLFGNWYGKNSILRLNVPRNTKINRVITRYHPLQTHLVQYKRDQYGLRGPFEKPALATLVTVGGSTTDQSEVDDGKTWQDVLAADFRKDGKNIQIANAGIDGQTVFANSRNFVLWFPKIPNFKPKYALAYIGINDLCADSKFYEGLFKESWAKTFRKNSAFFYLYRTFRGIFLYLINPRFRYEVALQAPELREPEKWTSKPALGLDHYHFENHLKAYERRLRRLLLRIREFGSIPIFVTQRTYEYHEENGQLVGTAELFPCWDGTLINGVDAFYLMTQLNNVTLDVCRQENLICFDLAGELKGLKREDFIDLMHNTASGSEKIGHYLYRKLKPVLEENSS